MEDEKEKKKKEGNVEGSVQNAELVGAGLALFGDIGGEKKQAPGQYPEGDEGVSIIPDPTEKEWTGAKNNKIYSKSSFFQQTNALSKAGAIRNLPYRKEEVAEIFFD